MNRIPISCHCFGNDGLIPTGFNTRYICSNESFINWLTELFSLRFVHDGLLSDICECPIRMPDEIEVRTVDVAPKGASERP